MNFKKVNSAIGLALVASMMLPLAANASVVNGSETLKVSKTSETIGDFKVLKGSIDGKEPKKVFVYDDGVEIFKTDDATFKDMFVIDETPYIVVNEKGAYKILKDAPSGKYGTEVGRIYPEGLTSKLSKDKNFKAVQEKGSKRVVVYQDGKQIFRTNGDGDDGTLVGMFVHNDEAYVIVNHYKKGLMVLTDGNAGSISAKHVTTIEFPVTYTAKQEGERVVVTQGQEAFSQQHQIFRTNGDGDNGTLKDAFLVKREPFIMVEHYKKGNMILTDGNSGSIAAKWVGNYYEEAQDSLTKDGFTAIYNKGNGKVNVLDVNGKDVFRTNGKYPGEGDNGTLQGLFVYDGEPFIVVNNPRKGLTILGKLPSTKIGTQHIGTLYE